MGCCRGVVRYASRAAKYLLQCSYHLPSPLATQTRFPTEMGTLEKKIYTSTTQKGECQWERVAARETAHELHSASEVLDDWNMLWEKNRSKKPAVYNKNHFSLCSTLYAELTLTYAQSLLTSSPPSFTDPAHSTSLAPGWLHVGRCKTKQNWATRIRKKGAIPYVRQHASKDWNPTVQGLTVEHPCLDQVVQGN